MGLLILVDALDGKSLLARSRSAELLHAVALHRGVPLAAMIMQQPRIMEYIGRRLKTKPGLLISLTEALEVKVTPIRIYMDLYGFTCFMLSYDGFVTC